MGLIFADLKTGMTRTVAARKVRKSRPSLQRMTSHNQSLPQETCCTGTKYTAAWPCAHLEDVCSCARGSQPAWPSVAYAVAVPPLWCRCTVPTLQRWRLQYQDVVTQLATSCRTVACLARRRANLSWRGEHAALGCSCSSREGPASGLQNFAVETSAAATAACAWPGLRPAE